MASLLIHHELIPSFSTKLRPVLAGRQGTGPAVGRSGGGAVPEGGSA